MGAESALIQCFREGAIILAEIVWEAFLEEGNFELGLKAGWTLDQEERGAPRCGDRKTQGRWWSTDQFGWSRGTGRRQDEA